jgi:alkyl hydroperoxide reductase subunit F
MKYNLNVVYDLIIIGGGPAGLTAAIYSVRNKLNVLIITKDIGGQMSWSGIVENYTGFSSITGLELTQKFEEHYKLLENNIVLDSVVLVDKDEEKDIFTVKTIDNEYKSQSVLICSGKNPKKLNIPGEVKLLNRGVVYCAICDGPLFAKKVVAIVGGGNSALDAAAQMINSAEHVYVINKNSFMKGDLTLFEKVSKSPNVTFIYDAMTLEIKGEKSVKSILISQKGVISEIDVQGVFVQIGLLPNTNFVIDVAKNEYGEIIVDHDNKTNIPGLFAAGDVTQVSEKQIIIAAGDASKAALNAFKYLSKKN